ncbi:MAG: hypothetical protein RLZZ546_1519 [Bacteroidota bacterium]|jgi:hypothetical protein
MKEIEKIGFISINNSGYWIRGKKWYLIWNKYSDSFNFYEIVGNDSKIKPMVGTENINVVNGYILNFLDMYHYTTVVGKIVSYLRKERIFRIIDDKEWSRCPSCGHNYFSGGYGICKWRIDELESK